MTALVNKGGTANLLPVFLVVFIGMLGIGIVIPTLAPALLAEDSIFFPAGTSFQVKALALGFAFACFSIAQFFSAPVLGGLSDRHGRKPVLLITMLVECASYSLFAIGAGISSLPVIFIARSIGGISAGNLSVAFSAIADLSDEAAKVRNFGLVSIAFGLGTIIGPLIGGKLSDPSVVSWFTYSTPFWVSAGLSLLNVVLLLAFFKETIALRRHVKLDLLAGFKNVKKAIRTENMRTVLLTVFFFSLGFNFFSQFFQVLLIERFSFTASSIGDMAAYFGLWIVLAQGVIIRPLSARFSAEQVIAFLPLIYIAGVSLVVFQTTPEFLWAILPFVVASQSLMMPNLLAIVSRLADKSMQGEALGINQSVQSLGQVVPAILAGVFIAISPELPLASSACLVLIGWLVFIVEFHHRRKRASHAA